jgi:hypothetical protein
VLGLAGPLTVRAPGASLDPHPLAFLLVQNIEQEGLDRVSLLNVPGLPHILHQAPLLAGNEGL